MCAHQSMYYWLSRMVFITKHVLYGCSLNLKQSGSSLSPPLIPILPPPPPTPHTHHAWPQQDVLYYVTQFVWHSNLHSWSNESTCPLRSLSQSPSTKTREERGCAYAHWATWEHCCHPQLYQSLLKSTRRLSSKFWHSLVEPLTSASSLGVTTLFYIHVCSCAAITTTSEYT